MSDFIRIHDRHHDVQEHQIEFLFHQQFEGLLAVLGLGQIFVPLPFQPSSQRETVTLVIVYDEKRRTFFAHASESLVSSSLIRARRNWKSTGLEQ